MRANQRSAERGLSDSVRFHLRDYRHQTGTYDRIAGIGILEHIGSPNYPAFFAKVAALLTDDGVALLHTISHMDEPYPTNPWLDKYIFPGGYAPALSELLPAIERAREEGVEATGPIPGDTVFSKMAGGQYDIVVVMYHDQGHIPTKLRGFHFDEKTGAWGSISGVNITAGLPIIRVSVDHGTAFDIAGKGIANPESMIEAVHVAAQMVVHHKV